MRRATLRMRSELPTEVPPYFWTINAMVIGGTRCSSSRCSSDRAKGERCVGPAEAEGVGKRGADSHLARRVGNKIKVAFWVAMEKVRRRRRDLVAQRQRGEHRFDAAGGAKQ